MLVPLYSFKEKWRLGVKVFTKASISRIRRRFCPLFHHSHIVHRPRPARRTRQNLTWALAAFLDILPAHLFSPGATTAESCSTEESSKEVCKAPLFLPHSAPPRTVVGCCWGLDWGSPSAAESGSCCLLASQGLAHGLASGRLCPGPESGTQLQVEGRSSPWPPGPCPLPPIPYLYTPLWPLAPYLPLHSHAGLLTVP